MGINAELIKGSGGIFDIAADDAMGYSKHKIGRFPEDAEVLQALRSLSNG